MVEVLILHTHRNVETARNKPFHALRCPGLCSPGSVSYRGSAGALRS